MRSTSLLLLHLTAVVLGGAAPATETSFQAFSGQETLRTRVESEAATEYLAWLLQQPLPVEGDPAPALPRALASLDRRAVSSILDRDELQAATQRYSIDLATLLFARSILARPENAELQAIFTAELERLRGQPAPASSIRASDPTVLFVPGFLYRVHAETGGDFAIPRRYLTALGIANRLIETDEAGSVEDNAGQIAATLRTVEDDRVLIVSASKGGPEVALALGRLLEPDETRSVVGWINIGGLLGGSPLADQAHRPSRRWLVRAALWWSNLKVDGVRSLRTFESRRRLAELSLPPNLPIINLVPVPLSGDVSKQAAGSYRKLRRLGPNDGLALLADQILPGSRTLLRLGDDHFLTRQDPRVLTLALLRTARHVIETRPPLDRTSDLHLARPSHQPSSATGALQLVLSSFRNSPPPATTGWQTKQGERP
jgi:hypothetical protein